jgi:hypothetical protein
LLLHETYLKNSFIPFLLSNIGWRYINDVDSIILLHHSGLFIEIINKPVDRMYTEDEKKLLSTLSLNLLYAKDTCYKVYFSSEEVFSGTAYANTILPIEITCQKLSQSASVFDSSRPAGIGGIFNDAPVSIGQHLVEVATFHNDKSSSSSSCEPHTRTIIEILKGYRLTRNSSGKFTWHERLIYIYIYIYINI